MNRVELIEVVRRGENSGVEFKRDDIAKDSLAKEIAALLNLEGGYILLGVEDDQTVSGMTEDPQRREEWVMQVAGNLVHPGLNPFWETLEWEPGVTVGVILIQYNRIT
ncbi:MAG: ATP-binding protein [Chloroflexi bacterium]|nr:ATP-binding protein [Chloroflexota bacterium]